MGALARGANWRAPALHEAEWSRVFAASEVFRRRFALVNLSFLDHRADGHVAHAMRHSDESKHKAALDQARTELNEVTAREWSQEYANACLVFLNYEQARLLVAMERPREALPTCSTRVRCCAVDASELMVEKPARAESASLEADSFLSRRPSWAVERRAFRQTAEVSCDEP